MRSFVRSSIVASCLGAAVIASGCDSKQATEYVTGISTQVTVPRDLKAVRVEVNVGGVPQFCRGYRVYDGKVQLPRSLGSFASTDGAITSGPITFTIAGLTTEDTENPFFGSCVQARVTSDQVRILRKSRQPYIRDEILFLPMPLKFACYDKDCESKDGVEMTCKGGKCVNATLSDAELKALKPFTSDLVDGTGGTCFRRKLCVTDTAAPAIVVDPTSCTYAVPNTASAPPTLPGVPNPFSGPPIGEGVNVEVVYDGGLVREVLDIDPQEGFILSDPANPQRFRLAEGLCEMVKGVDSEGKPTAHRITAVRTSGACRAKSISQPFCASDMFASMGLDTNGVIPSPPPSAACSSRELKPPQSALIVVVDHTSSHQAFFTALQNNVVNPTDEDSFVQPAIKAALSDPAFQRTDIGMVKAPGANGCTANATTRPEKLPVLAATARDPILADLANPGPLASGSPRLGGALARAYTELNRPEYSSYFRRAVLVLASTGFNDPADCGAANSPISLAQTAANNPNAQLSIKTYVMQLTRSPDKTSPWPADQLSNAGGTGGASYKTQEASAKFQEIVNSLATCVYDTDNDPAAPVEGDIVSFASPLSNQTTTLSNNASCNTEGQGSGQGWGSTITPQGKKRIFLCPESCTTYRQVLEQTTKFTAIYQQPPLPVPVFAYKAVCQ
jgi:hypothetical protein